MKLQPHRARPAGRRVGSLDRHRRGPHRRRRRPQRRWRRPRRGATRRAPGAGTSSDRRSETTGRGRCRVPWASPLRPRSPGDLEPLPVRPHPRPAVRVGHRPERPEAPGAAIRRQLTSARTPGCPHPCRRGTQLSGVIAGAAGNEATDARRVLGSAPGLADTRPSARIGTHPGPRVEMGQRRFSIMKDVHRLAPPSGERWAGARCWRRGSGSCRATTTSAACGRRWWSPGIAAGRSTGSTRTSPKPRSRVAEVDHTPRTRRRSSPSWVGSRCPRRARWRA